MTSRGALETAGSDPLDDVDVLRKVHEVGRLVEGPNRLGATLDGLAALAAELLGGCVVGMTVRAGGRARSAGASDPAARQLDDVQHSAGSGPCVEAMERQQVVEAAGEELARWPAFGDAARRHGIERVLALPLSEADEVRGALNVYDLAAGGNGADDRRRRIVALVAEQSAVAISNARLYDAAADLARNLQVALETRGVIERAKGVLMARQGCDADAAFDVLRRASQRTNRKLRDIAEDIIGGGTPAA